MLTLFAFFVRVIFEDRCRIMPFKNSGDDSGINHYPYTTLSFSNSLSIPLHIWCISVLFLHPTRCLLTIVMPWSTLLDLFLLFYLYTNFLLLGEGLISGHL